MEEFSLTPTLPKKLYDMIEEDVTNLHIDLGLSIPIVPKDIAHALGYEIFYLSEYNSKEIQSTFRSEEGVSIDGLSFINPNTGTFQIWVNDVDIQNPNHDDFTIMHEVGHIRMGHKVRSPLAEIIANYYAAYALVPSPLPTIYGCETFIDIANVFNTSESCAYNCIDRINRWAWYGGAIKPYEQRLITYYKKVARRR